jgi:hypothetical protein
MADIESLVKKFVAAQHSHDVDAIVNCYAPNGARVYGQGETRGRTVVAPSYRHTSSRGLTRSRMRPASPSR